MSDRTETLLFEVGTEELPVSYFTGARAELAAAAREALKRARLGFGEVRVLGTPRRLALVVTELAHRQATVTREVRGPSRQAGYDKEGKPTKALLGFAKSQGVNPADLVPRGEPGKEYLYAIVRDEGRPVTEVLPEILPKLIFSLSFPKVMRWEGEAPGEGDILFARPIRWLLCLYGSQVIPVRIGKLTAGRESRGHRFLHPGSLVIDRVEGYEESLKQVGMVLVDPEERRSAIEAGLQRLAAEQQGVLYRHGEGLWETLTHLVEYPTPFIGSFDPRFLELPPEVLTTVMIHHQRYFPLEEPGQKGKLLPKFLGVRNGDSTHLGAVIGGNERVLSARFADAVYFFKKDREVPLADRLGSLDRLVFQKDLGTYGAKTRRVVELSRWIAANAATPSGKPLVADPHGVERTAELCKADLVTQMVFEFPELQGVMGRIYARESKEPEPVPVGIEEHYRPRGADDSVPSTVPGTVVGLADRADTLAGCFGLGLVPSGSSDPYGLRRSVLGIIWVVLAKGIVLDLEDLFRKAFDLYEPGVLKLSADEGMKGLLEFVLGRVEGELLSRFQNEAIQNDLTRFILPVALGDLAGAVEKVKVAAAARRHDAGRFTLQVMAAVRVVNILKKSLEVSPDGEFGDPDPTRFRDPEETDLWESVRSVGPRFFDALGRREFAAGWEALEKLVDPINRFFDKVLVMDPDEAIRENRMKLLGRVYRLFRPFGDLTQIVLE